MRENQFMRAIAACGACLAVVLLTGCPAGKSGREKPTGAESENFTIEGLPETVPGLNGKQIPLSASLSGRPTVGTKCG